MFIKLVLVSALVAAALADRRPYDPPQPTYSAPAPSYSRQELVAPASYQFGYAVNDAPSGNGYGHKEGRNGYDTQGSYYVQLSDGRLQRVDYTVNGDSGYLAQVKYEGEAKYQQQGYGPPAPSLKATYDTPSLY